METWGVFLRREVDEGIFLMEMMEGWNEGRKRLR
jgi:hypothetical protein